MRRKKGNLVNQLIVVIMVAILVIMLTNHLFYKSDYRSLFCKDKGYDTKKVGEHYNYINIEEGYIECCNDTYINHKLVKTCNIYKLNLNN